MNCSDNSNNTNKTVRQTTKPISPMSNIYFDIFIGTAQILWSRSLPQLLRILTRLQGNPVLSLLWTESALHKFITISLNTQFSLASTLKKCTSNMRSNLQVSHVPAQAQLNVLKESKIITSGMQIIKRQVVGWRTRTKPTKKVGLEVLNREK